VEQARTGWRIESELASANYRLFIPLEASERWGLPLPALMSSGIVGRYGIRAELPDFALLQHRQHRSGGGVGMTQVGCARKRACMRARPTRVIPTLPPLLCCRCCKSAKSGNLGFGFPPSWSARRSLVGSGCARHSEQATVISNHALAAWSRI